MCTFSYVLKESGLTKSEMARVLEIAPSSINIRLQGTNDIKISELEKIEAYVGRKLFRAEKVNYQADDQVFLPYLSIPGVSDELIKSDRIRGGMQFDRDIVKNDWRKKPENLRITKMIGNKMHGGQYALKNKDILVVDISSKDPLIAGLYVCTFNKTQLFIAGIAATATKGIEVYYYNDMYEKHEYTAEQLKELNFEIHGRVIKNQSLTI
ncbi:MAG: hypothetical protein NC408_04400 [Candidatus Gastranaerophilales bacterium]|nr:hypothetical protein [Candidatus Gastranaerophilales bacterium]MCM1072288.1 hypothetical protein [Bacteroides sp.]